MTAQPIDPRAVEAADKIDDLVSVYRLYEGEPPSDVNTVARIIQSHFAETVNARLLTLLSDLTRLVRGECPSLLDEDSGGDSKLSIAIDDALSLAQSQPPSMADELAEALDFFVNQGARPGDRIEARELLARYDAQKGHS